jgi:hypothetical protein
MRVSRVAAILRTGCVRRVVACAAPLPLTPARATPLRAVSRVTRRCMPQATAIRTAPRPPPCLLFHFALSEPRESFSFHTTRRRLQPDIFFFAFLRYFSTHHAVIATPVFIFAMLFR